MINMKPLLICIAHVQAFPVTFGGIQKATRRDTILGKVYHYVREGWPTRVPEELQL